MNDEKILSLVKQIEEEINKLDRKIAAINDAVEIRISEIQRSKKGKISPSSSFNHTLKMTTNKTEKNGVSAYNSSRNRRNVEPTQNMEDRRKKEQAENRIGTTPRSTTVNRSSVSKQKSSKETQKKQQPNSNTKNGITTVKPARRSKSYYKPKVTPCLT